MDLNRLLEVWKWLGLADYVAFWSLNYLPNNSISICLAAEHSTTMNLVSSFLEYLRSPTVKESLLKAPSESFWVVYDVVRTKSMKYVVARNRMAVSSSFEPVLQTTVRPRYISGQVLSSHSIVLSSRTVRPCSPWGGGRKVVMSWIDWLRLSPQYHWRELLT